MADEAATSARDRDRPRGAGARDHRDRAREAPPLQGRAGDDGARRRRQGLPDPDRGAARPRLRLRRPRRAGRRRGGRGRGARARDHDRQLRRQADPLPRRVDRGAGGQRHRQRPRGLRRPPARAHGLAGARGGARRRRAAGRGRGDGGERAARPASRSSAGDTKVVERGHCDSMYVCTTGLGRIDDRARLGTGAIEPGDRVLVSGPIGAHGTAIMLARDELGLDAEVASDTRSLWPAVDAMLEAAGPALRCMRDATRGGVASALNELARASGVAIQVSEAAVPVLPGGRRRRRAARDRPDVHRQRGSARRLRRPRATLRRRSPRCARRRAARRRRRSARSTREPPGMVLVETAFGGRRVMDLLAGDPLPRIC